MTLISELLERVSSSGKLEEEARPERSTIACYYSAGDRDRLASMAEALGLTPGRLQKQLVLLALDQYDREKEPEPKPEEQEKKIRDSQAALERLQKLLRENDKQPEGVITEIVQQQLQQEAPSSNGVLSEKQE